VARVRKSELAQLGTCTLVSEVWGAERAGHDIDMMLAEVQGWCRGCRGGARAVQVVQERCRGGTGGAGTVQATCTICTSASIISGAAGEVQEVQAHLRRVQRVGKDTPYRTCYK
jgi:hypothetical protein